jgi:hypothetical protein
VAPSGVIPEPWPTRLRLERPRPYARIVVRTDVWRADCEGNIGIAAWFGGADSSRSTPLALDVARAIWAFPDLAGPVALPTSASVDVSAVGQTFGGALLGDGWEVGCSVIVYDSGSVYVLVPEDGFARLFPPWPYGDEKFGEQAAILEAADRWMTRLIEHVQSEVDVAVARADEI